MIPDYFYSFMGLGIGMAIVCALMGYPIKIFKIFFESI